MKEMRRCVVETNPLVSLLSGCAAGAINLGGGGVCALALLELMAGRKPEFGPTQVLSILAGGAFIGLVLAPAFVLMRNFFNGSGTRRGVFFGLLLFALLLVAIAPLVLKQTNETILGIVVPAAILAAAAWIGYGTMLATAVEEFERPWPQGPNASKPARGTASLRNRRCCTAASLPFCHSNN